VLVALNVTVVEPTGADVSVSDGQATFVPSQTSCGSQMPAVARHTVPADVRASLGHADPLPVQVSAGSQMPALARQIVPVAV
jgi:hypothetical protein